MPRHHIARARTAYAGLIADFRARGYSPAQTRGALAALLVIESKLLRAQALAVVRAIV